MVLWNSVHATGQYGSWRRDVEWINEGRGGGTGQLTYCYSYEQCFEKSIVFGQKLEDLFILRDVDEDCEGIFRYGLFAPSRQRLLFS